MLLTNFQVDQGLIGPSSVRPSTIFHLTPLQPTTPKLMLLGPPLLQMASSAQAQPLPPHFSSTIMTAGPPAHIFPMQAQRLSLPHFSPLPLQPTPIQAKGFLDPFKTYRSMPRPMIGVLTREPPHT